MEKIFNPVRMDELRECKRCGKLTPKFELSFSYDCHGIPFRPICLDCLEKVHIIGYDGEYYTEFDEQIDDDY